MFRKRDEKIKSPYPISRPDREAETFEDFLEQLQEIKKMGPLQNLLKMLPGIGSILHTGNFTNREKEREDIFSVLSTKSKISLSSFLNIPCSKAVRA